MLVKLGLTKYKASLGLGLESKSTIKTTVYFKYDYFDVPLRTSDKKIQFA